MAAHKYTEIREMVKQLYLDGYTKAGIAQELGVEINKVGYILYVQLKSHLESPKKIKGENLLEKMPKPQINRIIVLTNFGYTGREIAEDLNIPYCRVSRLITEAKIRNLIQKKV